MQVAYLLQNLPLQILPDWLQSPYWIVRLSQDIGRFINDHQAAGLFIVICAEEMGVPLPVPGDVAITWAGYLTTIGRLSYTVAFLCVVFGATIGATVLFTISRALGHSFLVRYGRFIGLDARKLLRVERSFERWGPWAIIIGRLIPGFRIVVSAFSGAFNVPYRIFVPSAFLSSLAWTAFFLELGRHLGPRTIALFHLIPAHLFPVVVLLIVAFVLALIALGRSRERRRLATEAASLSPPDAVH